MTERFRPLSQRNNPTETYEGPHEGVPDWLWDSVLGWLTPLFTWNYQGTRYGRDVLLAIERTFRIQLSGSDGSSKWASLQYQMSISRELMLDVLDYALKQGDSDLPPDELDSLLTDGGSVWTVAGSDGAFGLERRVDPTAAEAASAAIQEGGRPSEHLAAAWSSAFGRNPVPSHAYSEAVKAVEAAAKPIVTPNDDLATLGKMIVVLRDAGDRFGTAIDHDGFSGLASMRALFEMVWKGQVGRHGTDDVEVPSSVTQESAEAAVYAAVAAVQLVRSGAVWAVND